MTKAEEIQILQSAAEKLGPASYCGPWLEEVIMEIEHEIRSDMLPSPSIVRTTREAEAILETALRQAGEIIETAKKGADKIVQDAYKRQEEIRAAARQHLQSLYNKC